MATDATDGATAQPVAGEAPHGVTVGEQTPSDGGPTAGSRALTTDPAPPKGPSTRRRRRWLVEWAIIIAVAVVVAILVRTFIFQTFYIPSGSMEPTLKIGDRIVVNKLSYDFHSVHRGDIVVFTTPPNENCAGPPVPDLVKRVVGLPGETISARHGMVDINGKPLPEPWLPKISSSYTANFGPIQIPKGDYFMMGDNRTDSCDSRSWGPVSGSTFVGHVIMRIWPVSKITFF